MKIKTFARRATKTVLWACLFPWIWGIPFGISACGAALFGVATPAFLWSFGIALGIVAAVGTAGVIYNSFSKDKQPDSS